MTRRSWWLFGGSLGAVALVAVVLAELLLQPTSDERGTLAVMIIGPVAIALIATPLLTHWVRRRRSVAGIILTVAVAALALGAASASVASNAMFVSDHDFRLFLVVLTLAFGIALAVGAQLTRPVAADIRQLGTVATAVAGGDLDIASGIERSDEVGRTAAAIDAMVVSLRDARQERERAEAAQRHLYMSIGHDLRTPLAVMRAAVESLEDGIAPDPVRYLHLLGQQVTTIEQMLDQLIEYARLEGTRGSPPHQRVSLAELADGTVEAMAPLATARRVRLQREGDAPAMVMGRPDELSRVLRNLVDNALRHVPEGGEVTVSIIDEGAVVHVRVHDDGPGFPAEFRTHAFEAFRRADDARGASSGGSGLGLAICRAIVDGHGGRIWLGEGPGGDIHFCIPTGDHT
jgi:signal transduction histidine kinase